MQNSLRNTCNHRCPQDTLVNIVSSSSTKSSYCFIKIAISACSALAKICLAPFRTSSVMGTLTKTSGFFQIDYVIFTHGACILSTRWSVECLENNQPVDTPPTFLNTTFCYSSLFYAGLRGSVCFFLFQLNTIDQGYFSRRTFVLFLYD